RVVGDGSARARRRLAALGPMLIPLTVLLWAVMLLVGYALIFEPYARGFEIDGKAPFPAWFNAIYISGYSITTLGVGDVVPSGMAMRLVMVSAAASGFLLITVAVTYLLSAYGALDRMTALAFEVHRFVGRRDGLGPLDVIVAAAETGTPDELSNWLASTSAALSEVVQTENEFPLLHYFHMPDERALTLALEDLLEIVTVCRTVLSPERYPLVTRGIVSAGTDRIVRGYFATLADKFGDDHVQKGELDRRREHAFEEAYARLHAAGLELRPRDDARRRYVEAR
ncbi:potassium channel family protein, partial [Deinococcus pimensis]|uniref:potassium channel family protein n=1 Tax=Deinococcus pimensis TaxID=309888 RepID=UPI00146FC1F9